MLEDPGPWWLRTGRNRSVLDERMSPQGSRRAVLRGLGFEHPSMLAGGAQNGGYPNPMRYSTYDRPSYAPAYGSGIAVAVYFVLGLLVAVANNYFDHLSTFGRLLSALLAVALWPLLLLGLDIRIR